MNLNVIEIASFKRSGSTNRASSEDARLLIAVDGTIAMADAVFSRMFGFSVDELEGRHLEDVILPSSRLTAKIAFEKSGRKFIARVLKRDGKKLSCLVSSHEYEREGSRFRVLRIQLARKREPGQVIRLPKRA